MSSQSTASAVRGPEGAAFAAPSPELEATAWALKVVPPADRSSPLRHQLAVDVDRLLARVARSRGALDVGLAEALAELSEGDRLLRLGWSNVGDYARERLGVAARTAQAMVHLGRALRHRPLLRAAVRTGLVSIRAAQAVLPVATGEAEAAWVDLACKQTVRGLMTAVQRRLEEEASASVLLDEVAVNDDAAPGAVTPGNQASAAGAGLEATVVEAQEDGLEVEAWQGVSFPVTPRARAALDEALEFAGRMLGHGAPGWQRLEGLAQEYLGAHPGGPPDDEAPVELAESWRGAWAEDAAFGRPLQLEPWARSGWQAELESYLEAETRRWRWLDTLAPVQAPVLIEAAPLPASLDAALQSLVSLRTRWDGLLGHLGLLVRTFGLWRDAGFASFGHYCRERLGLGVRSVEHRIALERRLRSLPGLRLALSSGRVSLEQARLVGRVAREHTLEAWLDHAAGQTCLALRREVESLEALDAVAPWPPVPGSPSAELPVRPTATAAQTCAPEAAAGGPAQLCAPVDAATPLRLRVPVRVARLLAAALLAAAREAQTHLNLSECLERVATHFIDTWSALPADRSTPQRRALYRDGHRCQVPGCSRAAVHAHHVLYRSRGGSDAPENLVSLCAAHHLHGVHRGWVRVTGVAPGGLTWRLGEGSTVEVSSPGALWGVPADAAAGLFR
jgi:hypothetical protein